MGWLGDRADAADTATSLQRVTRLRPELDDVLQPFLAEAGSVSDPVILELCRLRIAALHGETGVDPPSPAAIDAGLTDEMVASLARYPTAPCFTDHQRRCIAYAEQFVIDVHGLTDADAEGVLQGMTDAEFVDFTVALGNFDGLGRLRLSLGVNADGG